MQPLLASLRSLPPMQAFLVLLQEKMRRRAEAERRAKIDAERPPTHPPPYPTNLPSLLAQPSSPFSDLFTPSRYKVFFGGRGAAKSWDFAEAIVRLMREAPLRVLCTREYQNSISDSVHRLLSDTIDRLGQRRWFDVNNANITSYSGAEVIFKGLQKPQEIKSTEGIDIVWVAEAQNTSKESLEVLIPTIRKPGSEIWLEFNTTDEQAPVYDFVENPRPDSIVHKVNFTENPFFPEVLRREMEYMREHDYDSYLHVWEGHAKKISNAVIFGGRYRVAGFDEALWKEAERLFFGLDFGFARDPVALIRYFVLKNILYIEYEAFGVGVDFAGNMSDDGRGELEQLLDSVPEVRNWPIKGDSSRPETISFLYGKGFNVAAAEKWEGCVEDGITHIRGFNEIVIHPRCKHMAEEARLYKFKTDKVTGEVLPIIIDKNNHGWDAVRYGLDGYIQSRGGVGVWERIGR